MNPDELPGFGTPGPGNYPIASTLGRESPSFTMKGRTNSVPAGVGLLPNTIDIGATARQRDAIAVTPGPSTYSVPSYMGHGHHFTMKGRARDASIDRSMPSPATYTVNPAAGARSGSPSFTLRGRPFLPVLGPMNTTQTGTAKSPLPGPGSYKAEAHNPIGATGRMSSLAGRVDTFNRAKRHAQTPGPGQYDVTQGALGRDSSPKFSLAGRTATFADVRRNGNPGPGAYQVAERRGGGPAFSLAGRPKKRGIIVY